MWPVFHLSISENTKPLLPPQALIWLKCTAWLPPPQATENATLGLSTVIRVSCFLSSQYRIVGEPFKMSHSAEMQHKVCLNHCVIAREHSYNRMKMSLCWCILVSLLFYYCTWNLYLILNLLHWMILPELSGSTLGCSCFIKSWHGWDSGTGKQ